MKLISLTCDKPSFKPIFFKGEGVSLIVGDASEKEASSNGVGKTLALKLVNHCLGGRPDKDMAKTIPDWMFHLKFELNNKSHCISRSGDGKKIILDGAKIPASKLVDWLNNFGPFKIHGNYDGITFRSLYGRFARSKRSDRTNPITLTREQDYQALNRTLYLLGADTTLAAKKAGLRAKQLEIKDLRGLLKSRDERLQEILLGGIKPESYLKKIQGEIAEMSQNLQEMRVAADYDEIRIEADKLTEELRQKESELAIIEYQLRGIEASLKKKPDIGKEALSSFYQGLGDIFKQEALKHFEDVENFHHSLSKRRQERLNKDRARLQTKKEHVEGRRTEVADKRDFLARQLTGASALGDYEVVVRRLASKEEDEKRLKNFIEGDKNLQRDAIRIKKEMVEQDSRAEEYLETSPIEWADDEFRALVGKLYPQEAAGIALKNNTGENKLRYDLSVDVQGQDSDGINAARIVCFDWIIFMFGSNHNMEHLWHDNGLFDHIDPRQRAKWLSFVMESLKNTGKQYIVSLNTENYDSTIELLNDEQKKMAEESVTVRLYGDRPEHKLLGVQIGSSEK